MKHMQINKSTKHPSQNNHTCCVIFFVSNRGWKITEPLCKVGFKPFIIVCKGSFLRRVYAFILLFRELYRRPDALIFTDTSVWIGLLTWIAAKFFKRSYILRLRGDTVAEMSLRKKSFHINFFINRLIPDAKALVPVSEYLKKQITHQVPRYDVSKIFAVSTPVKAAEAIEPLSKRSSVLLIVTNFKFYPKIKRLLYMGNDFDELLEADTKAVIYVFGTGKLLTCFQRQKRKMTHSDRIHLKGFTPNVDNFYKSAKCLVHISDLDAYPSVVNEARAHGLPVIGSNTVGIKEQIRDNIDGLIIDEKRSLKDAWLFLSDNDNWKRISSNGYAKMIKENGFDVIGRRFLSIISQVAGK